MLVANELIVRCQHGGPRLACRRRLKTDHALPAQATRGAVGFGGHLKKYERFGGELGITEFVRLFWDRRKSGDWVRKLPKGLRDAFAKPRNGDEMKLAKLVAEGNREAAEAVSAELQAQSLRLDNAYSDQTRHRFHSETGHLQCSQIGHL